MTGILRGIVLTPIIAVVAVLFVAAWGSILLARGVMAIGGVRA